MCKSSTKQSRSDTLSFYRSHLSEINVTAPTTRWRGWRVFYWVFGASVQVLPGEVKGNATIKRNHKTEERCLYPVEWKQEQIQRSGRLIRYDGSAENRDFASRTDC